jgi:hypothetical protein
VSMSNAAPSVTSPAMGLAGATRVARAMATNLLARFAPSAYVRLTGQTGRGAAAEEQASDIARYFHDCLIDYFVRLGVAEPDIEPFLTGKVLLEYGPGDLPGVAALMRARGAEKVYCVDRFPLVKLSDKNARVIQDLIDAASGSAHDRLLSCLRQRDIHAGFDPRHTACRNCVKRSIWSTRVRCSSTSTTSRPP